MTFYVFFYLLLLLSFLLCAKLWCGMALVHIRPLNALWLKCPQRARVQKVSKKDASMFSHKTAPFYLFYLYRVKVPGRVRTLKGSECNGTKRKHDILHLPSPSTPTPIFCPSLPLFCSSTMLLVFPPLSTVAFVLLCPDPFSDVAIPPALTLCTKRGLKCLKWSNGLKGRGL